MKKKGFRALYRNVVAGTCSGVRVKSAVFLAWRDFSTSCQVPTRFLGKTLIIDLFRGCLVIKKAHMLAELIDGEIEQLCFIPDFVGAIITIGEVVHHLVSGFYE